MKHLQRGSMVASGAVLFVLCVVVMTGGAQTPQPTQAPDFNALKEAAEQLRKARHESLEKQKQLLKLQAELLDKRVQTLNKDAKTGKAASALAAIIRLNEAELRLREAQESAEEALLGARIVADDGEFLGTLAPTYDPQSAFCPYGQFGADYAQRSIWCNYGKYGASYQMLSPFCAYSTKPPKLLIDDVEIASVTVNEIAGPVAITPNALRAVFLPAR